MMGRFKDRTGDIERGYKALRFSHMSTGKKPVSEWVFECPVCSGTFVAQYASVRQGLRSCAPCRAKKRVKDLTGQLFGQLRAIGRVGSTKRGQALWLARCQTCGEAFQKGTAHLQKSKGCPCGRARETHGLSRSPTYRSWNAMMMRCTNPLTRRYDRYGGRGIKVCDRWTTFASFLDDMGPRPRGASLDRINNDGNYEPGNCRWATRVMQRRNMDENTTITYGGLTLTLAEWAERLGMAHHTLRWRYVRQGWSAERSLTEPISRGDPAKRRPFKP